MMIRIAVLIVVAMLGADSLARQTSASASDGWVKAPAPGETTAAAFVKINNPTAYDVYVVSAESDVAGKVQLQRATKAPEAKPEPITSFTVDAYGSVTMRPDGLQLRLLDLKRPLKVDETITLTLTTDAGTVLEVPAVVRKE